MIANKTKNIFIPLLILSAISAFLAYSTTTMAADYTFEQQVLDPGTPVDVCPNIPGAQPSIPAGMQVDLNGNCYTPAPNPPQPPNPPVTTDLCLNITGIQTSLPSGHFRTSAGNCYLQPAPPATPTDVCSNIPDLQITMPDGYYLTVDNTCENLPEPVDVCPNIPGPQENIPDGMKLEDDVCFTPSPATNPNENGPDSSESTNNNGTTKNSVQYNRDAVPGPLQPLVESIINLIPENIRNWLRGLPVEVAQSVPFYIFIILAILAIVPILQSIREAMFVRQLAIILKRERDIAEQKDNFMTLASHYLRTPLTLMKNGIDTVLNEGAAKAKEPAEQLSEQINSLDKNISLILKDVENNTALRSISEPQKDMSKLSVWKSGWFWGPIVGSIILTVIANFLLVVVGDKDVAITTTFFQFLVAIVAITILYLGVRNMHLQKRLHDENQSLIDHEKTVDEARNSFINSTTVTLQQGLDPINQTRQSVEDTTSMKFVDEGYNRMKAMLEKFLLLGQIQAGAERETEVFDLHESIDNLLVSYHAQISEKRLTVANMTSTTFIKQNRLLFNFVVGSVLDNAIKFNQPGGKIEIGAEPNSKQLTIKVSDNGIGIDSDRLGQLFKPFSRTTSAVEFDYEGLGFSLFLDKIIMDYTGGTISAASSTESGTQMFISTPVATNA